MLRKATATGAIFHLRLQCNFQNCYRRCRREGKFETRLHQYTCDGKICLQNIIRRIFIFFLQLFRRCCIASARHVTYRNLCMRRQCNNLLKLHCHREQTIARVPGLKTSGIFWRGGGGGGSSKSGAILGVSKFEMVITLFKILKQNSFQYAIFGV